ncbi:hypothetical protein QOZ95_002910 [Paenibacillus brasilensis]|uniref:Uncharacterized protein n=1 Tax=Paenibacillus brasilensis TaxID=128574 RepID=A0ABU0KZ85_9BACL|nr:hypothetical protein [Paenibacillus brasilensis]
MMLTEVTACPKLLDGRRKTNRLIWFILRKRPWSKSRRLYAAISVHPHHSDTAQRKDPGDGVCFLCPL